MEYNGLPADLRDYLSNYSNEELLQDPNVIIRSIIRIHAVIQGGMGGLIEAVDIDNNDDEDELPMVDSSDLTESQDAEINVLSLSRSRMMNKDTVLFTTAALQTGDPSRFFEIKH